MITDLQAERKKLNGVIKKIGNINNDYWETTDVKVDLIVELESINNNLETIQQKMHDLKETIGE